MSVATHRLSRVGSIAFVFAVSCFGPPALAHDDAAPEVPAFSHPRGSERIRRPRVPANIEAPRRSTPFLVGHAIGTQNYLCAPAATLSGVDWLAIGPQATLFDAELSQIITHFQSKNPAQHDAIQATWQDSRDTSAVWATKLQGSTDTAYVRPGAIEWLLLEVTGAQLGPAGGDRLADAVFVQRIHTIGGSKPAADECTQASVNTRQLVSYQADYYFYR